MIDRIPDIGFAWKLFFLGLLMAAVAAVTYHYTSKHYVAKIEGLDMVVQNRDAAIKTANESIGDLMTAIETQNKAFEEIEKDRSSERAASQARLVVLERDGRLLYNEIASLKEKVKRPVVDLSKMTTVEVAAEVGECRRAVEINNIADTGELI